MRDEEVLQGNVAHTVANARNLGVLYEQTHQVVIAAAAEHSAVVFGGKVEHLEYGARVVVQTADDAKVKYTVFVKARLLGALWVLIFVLSESLPLLVTTAQNSFA